jgi:hypothetical protein
MRGNLNVRTVKDVTLNYGEINLRYFRLKSNINIAFKRITKML